MNIKREKDVSAMIFEALCVLIIDKKRETSKLSVKDIVEEAGVCRNSFYRNYSDIDEILLKKMDSVWSTTAIDDGIERYEGVEKTLYYYFSVVRSNERFFRAFYMSNPGRYFDMFSRMIIQSNSKTDSDQVSKSDYYRYACRAWVGVGIMTEWMLRDFDLSTDEMIRLVMNAYKDW